MPTLSNDRFSLEGIDLPVHFPYHAYESVDNWEHLIPLGDEITMAKGATVVAEENAEYCYLVTSGKVVSANSRTGGSPRPAAFFLKGSLFLESNALSHLSSDALFTALENTTLIRIDNEVLKQAMMKDSVIFNLVITSLARKFFSATERLREIELYDVRMRVYLMFMGFAKDTKKRSEGKWHRIEFKLTQQTIAELLGVSRITVNTAIKNLEQEKMIKRIEGYYWINDAKGLLA